MIDLLTITREVKNIALEAGSFIRTERSAFDKNKIEKSMLTIMSLMWIESQNC